MHRDRQMNRMHRNIPNKMLDRWEFESGGDSVVVIMPGVQE